MKTDLATSIGAAIAGVLISYFVCNLFVGQIEDFTYKTVESEVTAEVTEPNVEVFNYKALNPTVEVYVGECDEYDAYGECLDTRNTENAENAGGIEDTENTDGGEDSESVEENS